MRWRGRGSISPWRFVGATADVIVLCVAGVASAQASEPSQQVTSAGATPSRVEDLRDLSIDQLAQPQVTSVAKSAAEDGLAISSKLLSLAVSVRPRKASGFNP